MNRPESKSIVARLRVLGERLRNHSTSRGWRILTRRFRFRGLPGRHAVNSAVPTTSPPQEITRAGATRVSFPGRFRVLFIIRPGLYNAGSTRYRGHNLIEALGILEVEATYLDDRRLPACLSEVLAFDLIVIVRREKTPEIIQLLEFAKWHSIPVICDLDDYLFDDEAITHSDYLQSQPIEAAHTLIREWRELIRLCGYYTGATAFLCDRAKSLASAHLIPNGLNLAQIELSQLALEEALRAPVREFLRLGYFSGTLTHQADFAIISRVLARLLQEFPRLCLAVVGNLELGEFPALSPFHYRIEKRPFVDWRLLPAEIARVDINLIPLVVNPFTEGKSDLKYFEAALLKVPSVASPTEVFRSCIQHGINGFLADSPDEWYQSLRVLILKHDVRREIGENAYQHVILRYVPSVIGTQALMAYRRIIDEHRRRLGVEDNVPTATIVLGDLGRALEERAPGLTLCQALTDAGARVTLQIDPDFCEMTAAGAHAAIANCMGWEPGFTVQVGREILCSDLLLATDHSSARRVCHVRQRARWAAYLVSEGDSEPLDELGLDLLVLDPDLAEILDPNRQGKVRVLPTWVESQPVELGPCPEPDSVLLISVASVPDHAQGEALLALDRISERCSEVRTSVCGQSLVQFLPPQSQHTCIPSMAGTALWKSLENRPICVVLHPPGRPPWIHGLMARGCPVISVSSHRSTQLADREFKHGIVPIPGDRLLIAQAIESLLIDRILLGSLLIRSRNFVSTLPAPIEAARVILHELQGVTGADLRLHEGSAESFEKDQLVRVA
jgi:glycosyltransferase involved in cell wall biosynthesis